MTFSLLPIAMSSPVRNDSPSASSPDGLLFQCSGNEIVPRKSLIKLETRSPNGNPVFVVSAIEGVIASLKVLASEIARPVWGLQCTKDAPLESISEFAAHCVKQIREVQAKGPYTILGYSFGALVAFEMALQLEITGEQVVLTLLDGSPEFITMHTKTIGKQAGPVAESLEADGRRKALAYFIRQMNSSVGFLKVS